HAPIAVISQKRERAENMEVSFDAASAEVNQQGGHEHLADRHDMARKNAAGMSERQENGEAGDCAAEKHRQPDVDMNMALPARPGSGRNPNRGDNTRCPLDQHENREKPASLRIDSLMVLPYQLARSRRKIVRKVGGR